MLFGLTARPSEIWPRAIQTHNISLNLQGNSLWKLVTTGTSAGVAVVAGGPFDVDVNVTLTGFQLERPGSVPLMLSFHVMCTNVVYFQEGILAITGATTGLGSPEHLGHVFNALVLGTQWYMSEVGLPCHWDTLVVQGTAREEVTRLVWVLGLLLVPAVAASCIQCYKGARYVGKVVATKLELEIPLLRTSAAPPDQGTPPAAGSVPPAAEPWVASPPAAARFPTWQPHPAVAVLGPHGCQVVCFSCGFFLCSG